MSSPRPHYPGTVLIVDDHADSARAISLLLQAGGFMSVAAADGVAAVKIAERYQPFAAIVDIGLPDIDGNDVARRIRASSWGRNIGLIAVSGRSLTSDVETSKQSGFEHFLQKPILDPKRLFEILAGYALASRD